MPESGLFLISRFRTQVSAFRAHARRQGLPMATTLYGIKNCELFLLNVPQKKPKTYLGFELSILFGNH
ncbi:TPA: hypothetical protein F3L13_06770 [Aeromonas hydrophila]|nr:hypothetical protein [Aeromonas hydrophila]